MKEMVFTAFVAQIDKSKYIVIKRSDKVINEQLQREFRDLDHLIELAVNHSPFTEYSDKEFIFAAIISFVDEIRKSIAAINAYGIIECKLVPVPPEQVELWELNIESVWRRLISDLSKLFDRAETCGKSNCSLQQLTVLARVSSGVVNCNKPFYDPLKDFMTMNRMMRRSMKDRGKELTALTVDKDYRQIDILAIYR